MTAGTFLTDAGTLAGAENALIEDRKLVGYSLNPSHQDGGDKALVFAQVLGYNRENADLLRDQILAGILTTSARPGLVDQKGSRFSVDLAIQGPTGRTAVARTGWIYEPGRAIPRLTTTVFRRRRTGGQASTP